LGELQDLFTVFSLPNFLPGVLISPALKRGWHSGSWGGSAAGSVSLDCAPECRLHQRHKIKVRFTRFTPVLEEKKQK
jgi:hypothetical protein